MKNNTFKKAVAALAVGLVSLIGIGADEIVHDTTGVVPGRWTSDFAAAKAYADANHVPLLSFWGSDGCGYCARMKRQGLNTDEFKAWIAKKPIVLVYTDVAAEKKMVATDVKVFTKGNNGSGEYPFMRMYWAKADGTTVSVCFTGRGGKMPVTSGTTAEQLVASLEKYFGSWTGLKASYVGGYFSVTNRTTAARLEAVAGKTSYVDIPMYRTEKGFATNYLQTASDAMVAIAWGESAAKTTYRYTLPTGVKAGTEIALKLFADDKKTIKSQSSIHVVSESANAISSPKWLGESFAAGEWTMDLDAAVAKKGPVIAVVGGDLWCPYCQALNKDVFSTSRFKTWALENNVSLVCIDMPQKDKTTATLLTYDESTAGASGASYLSRNMISESAATAIFQRNKTLSGATWRRASSSATRLGNPTVLLINGDKTVAARFHSPNNGKSYPIDECMNRLNELLLLAGGNDKAGDASTTPLALAVGGSATGTMQINDYSHFYKLSGLPSGKVQFAATAARPIVLSVWEYAGAGAVASRVAMATNTLAVSFTGGTGKYLEVRGFSDSKATYGTNTKMSYTVSSKEIIDPGTVQFAAATASMYEVDRTLQLKVTRSGGTSGRRVFNVSVDRGSASSGRVSVAPSTLTWENGVGGDKIVTVTVAQTAAYNPDEVFTVTLAAAAGSEDALGSRRSFALTVADNDNPSLPKSAYALRFYKKIAVNQSYAVSNLRGTGTVAVRVTSGALPKGVKLTYDGSAKKMWLSGTPLKVGSYAFSVTISDVRGDKTASSQIPFEVAVVDAKTLKSGDKGYNPILATSGTRSGSLPVYGKADSLTVVAGTATASVSGLMRATVKYVGIDGKKVQFSGYISSIDDDGTLHADLEKGSARATMTVLKSGKVSLVLSGISSTFGSKLESEAEGYNAFASTPKAYAGYYTVTLPVDESQLNVAGETLPTGTGYVVLKMNTSSFTRQGKVSWTGRLANGKVVSGISYLSGDQVTDSDGTWAYLPLVCAKSGYGLSAMLRIKKNASATYKNEPRVVLAAATATPICMYGNEYLVLDAFGGFYNASDSLSACCKEYYGTSDFAVSFLTKWFAASEGVGAIAAVPSARVVITSADSFTVSLVSGQETIRLRIANRTGIVSGSATVSTAKGNRIRLTAYGVLLPGWADCGCGEQEDDAIFRPLLSGMLYFTDSTGSSRSQRGFAFEFAQ